MLLLPSEDIYQTVEDCFTSDPDYIKYHWASNLGTQKCVEITVNELKNTGNYQLWKVVEGSEIIGMFGVENSVVLNPFFIKPKFRKKVYVSQFLDLVLGQLKKNWYIGLYTKNLPVINFFNKLGGKPTVKGKWNRQKVVIYEFSNGRMS